MLPKLSDIAQRRTRFADSSVLCELCSVAALGAVPKIPAAQKMAKKNRNAKLRKLLEMPIAAMSTEARRSFLESPVILGRWRLPGEEGPHGCVSGYCLSVREEAALVRVYMESVFRQPNRGSIYHVLSAPVCVVALGGADEEKEPDPEESNWEEMAAQE